MSRSLVCLDLRGDSPQIMTTPPDTTVLCLGNFDGVHIAHAALVQAGISLKKRLGMSQNKASLCGVFCFIRPTMDYAPSRGDTAPTHLTTLKEKLNLLAACGAEVAFLCDFPSVKGLSPEAFITLLKHQCGCIGVVCGENHHFGHKAQGSPDLLALHFGQEHTVILPTMEINGQTVSSSRIRAALADGDTQTAERLLGRPYYLDATVVHGKGLGRQLGFPTANQYFPAERLIPGNGVYAVLCHTPDGEIRPGVANVGRHPTVDACARVNCETYIPNFKGDLYGYRMKVEFLVRLRREQKFATLDELIAAVRQDAEDALAYVTTHCLA